MAAQLLLSARGMQLWSSAALPSLLLPGTGELCERGQRSRAESTGDALLFVAKSS